MKILSSEDEPVKTFKSKDLSVFPLFDISRVDAAALISALEDADPEYHHALEVRRFAHMYAGNHVQLFMFLWDSYYHLIDPTPPPPTLTSHKKKKTQVKIYDDDSDIESEDIDNYEEIWSKYQGGSRPGTTSTGGAGMLEMQALEQSQSPGCIEGATEGPEQQKQQEKGREDNQREDEEILSQGEGMETTASPPDGDQEHISTTHSASAAAPPRLLGPERIMSSSTVETWHLEPTVPRVEYHYLIFYLLVFMFVDDADLPLWLYWVNFTAQNEEPTLETMHGLIDKLWGRPTGNRAKQLDKLKKLAQKVTKNIYSSEIVPNKLRYFDAASGGAWSRPVRELRRHLRKELVGTAFWKRMRKHVADSVLYLDENYLRLQDAHPLSRWGRNDFELVGERRDARKDIRKFIRLYKTYLDMPLEEVHQAYGRIISEDQFDAENGGGDGTSGDKRKLGVMALELMLKVAAAPVALFKGQDAPLEPQTLSERLRSYEAQMAYKSGKSGKSSKSGKSGISRRQGGGMSGKSSRSFAGGDAYGSAIVADSSHIVTCLPVLDALGMGKKPDAGEEEVLSLEEQRRRLIPLEVVYKDSISMPLPSIYHSVHTAQERARQWIDAAERELSYSAFEEQRLLEARVAAEYMASLASKPRRQVVIDVSSSSSEGEGRGGEGGARGSESGSESPFSSSGDGESEFSDIDDGGGGRGGGRGGGESGGGDSGKYDSYDEEEGEGEEEDLRGKSDRVFARSRRSKGSSKK